MLDALDTAKFNLVNNPDNFMPVAFMHTPEKGLCVVAVQNADKYTATEIVCHMAYEHKAHWVVRVRLWTLGIYQRKLQQREI